MYNPNPIPKQANTQKQQRERVPLLGGRATNPKQEGKNKSAIANHKSQMARCPSHLTLTPSPTMASLAGAASSRLFPSTYRARISLSSPASSSSLSPLSLSSSSSYSFAPLKCLLTSPLAPHFFLNQVPASVCLFLHVMLGFS